MLEHMFEELPRRWGGGGEANQSSVLIPRRKPNRYMASALAKLKTLKLFKMPELKGVLKDSRETNNKFKL